jgi:predicted site-specific integrase-resolvase
MEYLTVKEMAEKWEISSRMVTIYCKEGRIAGAIKKGNLWLLPENAKKPEDQRKNNGKRLLDRGNYNEY